jgi:hypothetical protein
MALYLRKNLTFSVKENGGTAFAVQTPSKIMNKGI